MRGASTRRLDYEWKMCQQGDGWKLRIASFGRILWQKTDGMKVVFVARKVHTRFFPHRA